MTNSTTVGWVSEPDGRGTVGLLWSCIVTIFLCTWSAVHPNVPALGKPARRVLWERLGYVLLVIIAPEMMAAQAVAELTLARSIRSKTPRWTLRQCFFLGMGGFVLQTNSADDAPSYSYVGSETFVQLVDKNVLDWPTTTDAEIDDRSKADWVMKSVTLTQVTWFVAQIIGRAGQRLAVTPLELYTLGIVLGAAFMYIAWWNKPYDVRMPIVLQTDLPLPKGTKKMERAPLIVVTAGISLAPAYSFLFVLFAIGAMQTIGWDFEFPSLVEAWMWRMSGLGMVATSIALILWWKYRDSGRTSVVEIVLATLMVLFRAYTCVEVFVGLRAVPEGVYKTPQWSQYLPSIG